MEEWAQLREALAWNVEQRTIQAHEIGRLNDKLKALTLDQGVLTDALEEILGCGHWPDCRAPHGGRCTCAWSIAHNALETQEEQGG